MAFSSPEKNGVCNITPTSKLAWGGLKAGIIGRNLMDLYRFTMGYFCICNWGWEIRIFCKVFWGLTNESRYNQVKSLQGGVEHMLNTSFSTEQCSPCYCNPEIQSMLIHASASISCSGWLPGDIIVDPSSYQAPLRSDFVALFGDLVI